MTATAEVAVARTPRTPRSVPDPVLGALGTILLLLAAVVFVRGGESDGERLPLVAPPPITLLAPIDGETLDGPLVLVFDVPEELRIQPSGWGAVGLHLHLQIDRLELMPSTADVVQLPDGDYQWVVGKLEAGSHRVHLFWSDANHRKVQGGESVVVQILAP